MGGVCRSPTGNWHVWRLVMDISTKCQLLIDNSHCGDLTINDLELAMYVAHLHLFAPKMDPLEYIGTLVDNTDTEGWARRGIIIAETSVGPLLQEEACTTRQAHIHVSVEQIAGIDNKEADATSRLTHLTVHYFLKHFQSTFPHSYAWRLCLLL